MPLDRMQTRRPRKTAAGMEKRASSRLLSPDGRLCRLGQLFDNCDPHCAYCNEESFADFLFVPVIDGDRRSIGEIVSARFDLSGTTLPLKSDEFVRLRELRGR